MKARIVFGVSIVILAAAVVLTSCGRGKITNMSAKTTQNDIDVFAENYANAWSSGEPEAVAKFFAENGSLKVNDDKPAIGRTAISEVARGFMSALPDAVVTKDRLVKRSDGVVEFHWTLTGTNTGPRGTGNRVRISGFEEWRMSSDGVIAASQGHMDEREYKRQIREGVTP